MKKLLLFVAVAFVASSAVAQSTEQTVAQKETVSNSELSFETPEKKDAEIKRIEALIELRRSQGKKEDQLTRYYVELADVKEAVVISKTSN